MKIDHFAVAGRVGQIAKERTQRYIEQVEERRRRAQGYLPLDEAYALLKKNMMRWLKTLVKPLISSYKTHLLI